LHPGVVAWLERNLQLCVRRIGRNRRGLGWNNWRSCGRASTCCLGRRAVKPTGRNWDRLHLAHILYPDGSGITRDYRKFHSGWQNGLAIGDFYLHRLGQHHEPRRYRRRRRIGNLSWRRRGTDWISCYENYCANCSQDSRFTDAAGQDRIEHCVVFYPTENIKSTN